LSMTMAMKLLFIYTTASMCLKLPCVF
jgi:hypothetical protein